MNYRHFSLDEYVPGCTHFKWKEILYLPRWRIHVWSKDEQTFINLIRITRKLDSIRNMIGFPITVTSGYRPEAYNKLIGGSERSSHMEGLALDFKVISMHSDRVREWLEPQLEILKIRMENLPGSDWVHIDLRDPDGGRRFFIP